jgi:hypothetical protein
MNMKMKLFTLVLLAGSSLFAESHWSIGIGIGTPYHAPPPPPAVTYVPPCPGPECTWVPGYYHPVGARSVWHVGFWSRPPYAGAYWVAPHYLRESLLPGSSGHRERRWDRDDDERWDHHDRGLHRGWYRRHGDD